MEQLSQQMKAIYKIMAEKEFADSIAEMIWNIYQSSKEKGFTDEQAMAITLSFAKSQTSK